MRKIIEAFETSDTKANCSSLILNSEQSYIFIKLVTIILIHHFITELLSFLELVMPLKLCRLILAEGRYGLCFFAGSISVSISFIFLKCGG